LLSLASLTPSAAQTSNEARSECVIVDGGVVCSQAYQDHLKEIDEAGKAAKRRRTIFFRKKRSKINLTFYPPQQDDTFQRIFLKKTGVDSVLDQIGGRMFGKRDFDLNFLSYANQQNELRTALIKALTSPPLNLSTEIQSRGDILGFCSYRASSILKGWREIVTIRLQGLDGEDDIVVTNKAQTNIEVISTMYVNRQNTSQPNDWTLPSENQAALWVETMLMNIKNEMQKLCRVPQWVDRTALKCQ